MQQDYHITTSYRWYPLHPDTPVRGTKLRRKQAASDPDDEKARRQRGESLRGLMAEAGLDFTPGDTLYNSRMAQEFAAWARDQPGAGNVHGALYRAYFVDARNIGIIPVLKEIAEDLGYDTADAVDALKSRRLRDVIDADWREAMNVGITGVPTFSYEDIQLMGSQPWPLLQRFINHIGATPRST